MFLRQRHRTKDGKRHTYYSLVESVRTERGPRQRVIAELGNLTSSFFEGLAEDNDLAERGYSRDHRPDCKQIVLALVVTPDGFPLYHEVFAGNTNDGVAFPQIVKTMESQFGAARRVWVLDRGIARAANLDFLRQGHQSFLVGTSRSQPDAFEAELCARDWQQIRESVEVKCAQRDADGRAVRVTGRYDQTRLRAALARAGADLCGSRDDGSPSHRAPFGIATPAKCNGNVTVHGTQSEPFYPFRTAPVRACPRGGGGSGRFQAERIRSLTVAVRISRSTP